MTLSGMALGLVFLTKAEIFVAASVAVAGFHVFMLCVERPVRHTAFKRWATFLGYAVVPPVLAFALLCLAMPAWQALGGTLGSWRSVFNEELISLRFYHSGMGLDDPDRVSVEIAQRAVEPLKISFPNLIVFLPGGFFIGLLISVGLAFLLELMDDTVKTPRDVMRHLSVPLLGMIPLYEGDDEDEITIEKITLIHPHVLMSEFYRTTFSCIVRSHAELCHHYYSFLFGFCCSKEVLGSWTCINFVACSCIVDIPIL